MYKNVFGDTSMLMRTQVFQSLTGFSEDPGLAYTDWLVAMTTNICVG